MNFYATAIIFDTKFAVYHVLFAAQFRNTLTVNTFHRKYNELFTY